MQEKKQKKIEITLKRIGCLLICAVMIFAYFEIRADAAAQLDVTAYITDIESKGVANGQYEVRFALYENNRAKIDPYPSDSDARIWEETQTVKITTGFSRRISEKTVLCRRQLISAQNSIFLE
jgi:hypothetical protein